MSNIIREDFPMPPRRRSLLLRRSRVVLLTVVTMVVAGCRRPASTGSDWKHKGKTAPLSAAQKTGGMPLNEALAKRRSRRKFSADELIEQQLSQLCWAAQGINGESGKRTAPSAGALYPVTLLVADRHGVREYLPATHSLISRGESDVRKQLQAAALDQSAVGDAPACFLVTYDVGKTAAKYGKDAERYCLIEVGHVAQNLLLTATSLGLAAVPIGALSERRAAKILGLPGRLKAVYVIPVGHPAR